MSTPGIRHELTENPENFGWWQIGSYGCLLTARARQSLRFVTFNTPNCMAVAKNGDFDATMEW